ncbi:MAG: Sua5/YciO/YrdC/YwlC family protein, partial [Polyangiaceae bacterium]
MGGEHERLAITVSGTVQGVGFRPFVHGLAHRLGLGGFVQNRSGDVLIEVEGEPGSLERFVDELTLHPPPLARVDQVRSSSRALEGERAFRIAASDAGAGAVVLPPDVATCDDCLRELFDPADRRYRYPFLNCASCGPRLTIIRGVPYDRHRTTMTAYPMCAACRAEYEDPADRRFHAQPIACPACGPRLSLLDDRGEPLASDDPLADAIVALAAGQIVCVKGLGGYHLACDATNAVAVAELRRRKQRDAKPFAVMVPDRAIALALCELGPGAVREIESAARPIVVAPKRAGPASQGSPAAEVAAGVAPDAGILLGLMLPYTPLHHLLVREGGFRALVMTSGNLSDEPIAYEDRDAAARLRGVADRFLTHD